MFIDPLESRQMLAGDVGLVPVNAKLSKTGTLFVTGTSMRDTISVKSVAGEFENVADFSRKLYVVVSVTNKQSGDRATSIVSFPQASVKRIDISSGGGNDLVVANTGIKGRTTIYGGKGNDRLETTGKSGTLLGGSGNDVLTSNSSVASINTNLLETDPAQGAERAVPFSFNLLSGGDGDDTFRTRGGDDLIVGGAGNDRYEPLEAGVVTTVGTSLPSINYPSGTTFGTSRVALDSVETLDQEPDDLADVKVLLVGTLSSAVA